jgi:DNA polymerase III subunit epsilon
VEQRCIPHELEPMQSAVHELLAIATTLGDPPSIVGKAEVDQINIISRWIHRHSDDRAFFPLQPALTDIDEALRLAQHIWLEVDTVRATPIEPLSDVEEDI